MMHFRKPQADPQAGGKPSIQPPGSRTMKVDPGSGLREAKAKHPHRARNAACQAGQIDEGTVSVLPDGALDESPVTWIEPRTPGLSHHQRR